MALEDKVTICSNINCNMEYLFEPNVKPSRDICGKCGSKLIHTPITAEEKFLIDRVSKDRDFFMAMLELREKDIIEYKTKISQFRAQAKADGCYNKPKSVPKCPKCGCTEFTPLRRKFSLLTGFATNKVDMVCSKCGTVIK